MRISFLTFKNSAAFLFISITAKSFPPTINNVGVTTFASFSIARSGLPPRDTTAFKYYRVQGPTFLIEYNNTQNNANHVHSYWRDLAGDFGIPVTK